MVRVVKHRSRLSREAVESPSLDILNTQLAMVPGSLLGCTLLEKRGWYKMISKGCFQPKQFCEEAAVLDCLVMAIANKIGINNNNGFKIPVKILVKLGGSK